MGQDFATGVLFAGIGIAALLTVHFYDRLPMGTAQRPGTGVLPEILSWCLIASGGVLIVKALAAGDIAMERWNWRSLVAVTAATLAFGFLIDDLGLVVTMMISLTICALGTSETRWREYIPFLGIMIVGSAAIFVWLLGMPIPLWPVRVPGFLSAIVR
jgi:hypothetical protein